MLRSEIFFGRPPRRRKLANVACWSLLAATLTISSSTARPAAAEVYNAPQNPRLVIPLLAHWRHVTGNPDGAQAADFDDSAWSQVDLPHSYNAADGADGHGYYRGPAWYRTTVTVPAEFAGKELFLQLDGASFVTDVYIDGEQAGPPHRGGFSQFIYDVTPKLSPGPHSIAVKVDNSVELEHQMPPQGGDYTKSGGIYRGVRLIAVDPTHVALSEYLEDTKHAIASPGVYWSAGNASPASADVTVKIKLDNQSPSARSVDVASTLVDATGAICWQKLSTIALAAGQLESKLIQSGAIDKPHLWNGRIDPYLYDAYVEVRDHETKSLVDAAHTRFGIRSFAIDPDRGFILNGEPYDLRGASAHQDELGKSWARSDADFHNDIDLMLEMGATVVRTSHYPTNPAFYDYADQTGLIVYTEIPINGTTAGGKVPEGPEFLDAARDQMRELVRQHYNHPSIVVWGLYNEMGGHPAVLAAILNLQALTKEEERSLGNLTDSQEPLRKTTAASWTGAYNALEAITDTVGFNKYYGWYNQSPVSVGLARDIDPIHEAHPEVRIGMTEYGAGANVNQHEVIDVQSMAAKKENPSRSQWHPEDWQTWNHEQWWPALASRQYLWCKLIWQMFDSASDGRNEGDQPGINDKGLVTADRMIKKDAFFFYKANWNDTDRAWANECTLHIVDSRWKERTSNSVEVKVYSNLGAPTLTLNGALLGEMASQGYAAYTMNVVLSNGDNHLEAAAAHNGKRFEDSVVWICRPDLAVADPKPGSTSVSSPHSIKSSQ
jgi:beta-galactosidase